MILLPKRMNWETGISPYSEFFKSESEKSI